MERRLARIRRGRPLRLLGSPPATTRTRAGPVAALGRVTLLASLLLAAGPALAQEPDLPGAPVPDRAATVTVQATAEIEREPGEAVLQVAVETLDESAEAAAERNAERLERVIAALERVGIGADDRRTVSYQVRPEYEWTDAERRRLVGYRVVNVLEVTITDLDRVGDVIDATVEAGANRITGLRFGLADPEAARREALRAAVERARSDAGAIADAAGRRLGPLLRVSTGDVQFIPPPQAALETADAARRVRTPIEPGALTVTATVTAVYVLERP